MYNLVHVEAANDEDHVIGHSALLIRWARAAQAPPPCFHSAPAPTRLMGYTSHRGGASAPTLLPLRSRPYATMHLNPGLRWKQLNLYNCPAWKHTISANGDANPGQTPK